MKLYLEYKDEKSVKFWSIEVLGTDIVTKYGKIGAEGKAATKSFDSTTDALKEARKLSEAKIKKGYQDKTSEFFGEEVKEPKVDVVLEDVVDDGQTKPWHTDSYWSSWRVDMDMPIEELRNPKAKEIKSESNTLSEEKIEDLEYKLTDYGREGKVQDFKCALDELQKVNVDTDRLQLIYDDVLWDTLGSHWDASEEHIEIMDILLKLGAKLSSEAIKYIEEASETEETEVDDYDLSLSYSDSVILPNIGIFKKYIASGADPNKFRECVDSYIKEVFTEASGVVETILRDIVKTIKDRGDKERRIPGGKFTPDIAGLRIDITGDSIYIYPIGNSTRSWGSEQFPKTKEISLQFKFKSLIKPLTKVFDKLIAEGLFDGITNGLIKVCFDRESYVVLSKVVDQSKFESSNKTIFSQISKLESTEDWEKNADKLKDIVSKSITAQLETEYNRLLKILLKYLYSGNLDAEKEAFSLLSDHRSLNDEWNFEYILYSYRNFDFKYIGTSIKYLVDKGYEPAIKKYGEWLAEGIIFNSNDKKDGKVKTSYTTDEMFVETDSIIARADDKGSIRLRFKIEGEKGYSDALKFINNLTSKGYSLKYDGLQLTIYFLAEPMSNYAPEAFFKKAVKYPSLHPLVESYIDNVMYDYDHYLDQHEEEGSVIGIYAAEQLILADPKYLYLATTLADATDGEHEILAYYFTDDVIDRYGVTPESAPAIYELSLTSDSNDPNLPASIYNDPANIEALINHLNRNTHHFKGSKFLSFVRAMFDQSYKKALIKIKKLYDNAKSEKDKSIYVDFYNLTLSFLNDPQANSESRYGKKVNYGEPLLDEDQQKNMTDLGDQSCVMTLEEANAHGIVYDKGGHISDKCILVLYYLGERDANIIQHNIEKRNAMGKLSGNSTYPRYYTYSSRNVLFFGSKKWTVDLKSTEFRNGIILYDGKNKPIILYGVLDFAAIAQNVGKKALNIESLIKLRDEFTCFEAQKGAFYLENKASDYIAEAYQAMYAEQYNNAQVNISKVKHEDGEIYKSAQAFNEVLLNMRQQLINKAK